MTKQEEQEQMKLYTKSIEDYAKQFKTKSELHSKIANHLDIIFHLNQKLWHLDVEAHADENSQNVQKRNLEEDMSRQLVEESDYKK